MLDWEVLAIGRAVQVRAAQKKRVARAQADLVARINGQIVQLARDAGALDRRIRGAELRSSLNTHDGEAQALVRIA